MIYADAAASALKPQSVINAEIDFLSNKYANSGRGICARAAAVDEMVSSARETVAEFIGADNPEQIIFTSNATDGLNRVARTVAGKTIIVSDLDHHSARLPFEKHCKTIIAPLTKELNYDWEKIKKIRADAIVITAMSNVLGVPQEIPRDLPFIKIVDASQYIIHEKINVSESDIDYLIFSGHKIGADTGIGILFQKNAPEPVNWGGGMYQASGAARYEAGTLPLTQIAGLAPAIRGLKDARPLTQKLRAELSKNSKIKFISPAGAHILSFVIDGMNHFDFGAMMGANGICLRVGHMCATWLHKLSGIEGSARISLGWWNTEREIEQIAETTNRIINR
ncbi:MAG: aminotransferase class V-fold PLP-dependent enzyme [Rickettsiales bacterium]|jgi:selenocysteine lyase/cysteine desulfurase|nr:aminotransferase class V-fold PLP-dependent enzyme [Rickettsiales bacterium]